MKKIFILLAVLLCSFLTFAQAPSKMSYQSILRDQRGALLINKKITIQISILKGSKDSESVYIENQEATTNMNGLVTLQIGGGLAIKGSIEAIEWSKGTYFIKTETDPDGGNDFNIVGVSEFLSVPYAFSARQVENSFSGNYNDLLNKPLNLSQFNNDMGFITSSNPVTARITTGIPSQAWSLFGNSNTNPATDKLGTTDYKDLVMVTNNIERLRITKDGIINLANSLLVGNDLSVNQNVFLNTNGGATTNNGNFTVANSSSTLLTGTLNVNGATTLQSSLNVDNAAPTTLTGTLLVKENSLFEKNLTVTDTLFSREIIAKRFTLKDNVINGEYLASFENTNDSSGDGIKIKLGKTHPGWDGSAYINAPNPVVELFDLNVQSIRASVTQGDEFTVAEGLQLIPAALAAGTACKLVELLSLEMNSALGLPLNIGNLTDLDVFNAVNSFADELILDEWAPNSPTTIVPGFTLGFPTTFCPDELPSISMPNINFADVNNSLGNANHFIDFTDKENRTLGYVRAVSVTEWGNNYFDGLWLSQFVQKSVGLDPLAILTGIVNVGSEIVAAYNDIGVEYTSGNGDYAEWLERLNPEEFISKGDIVAVIGGKITKKLENAEQIMAISEKPIMLGNIPKENREKLGNNVAFMGQIPVKVIGVVKSGDYIIANNVVPGYGVAKDPSIVTIDDTKYIVGRSWEANANDGPKMVNTVIGVHNGDYLKIIKKLRNEVQDTKNRLNTLEAKVDSLLNSNSKTDVSLNK